MNFTKGTRVYDKERREEGKVVATDASYTWPILVSFQGGECFESYTKAGQTDIGKEKVLSVIELTPEGLFNKAQRVIQDAQYVNPGEVITLTHADAIDLFIKAYKLGLEEANNGKS